MLICDQASVGDRGRIQCRRTGGICVHVKYCELSMKWRQTDAAVRCPARRDDYETGKSHPV